MRPSPERDGCWPSSRSSSLWGSCSRETPPGQAVGSLSRAVRDIRGRAARARAPPLANRGRRRRGRVRGAAPFEPYDGVSLDAVAEALANGAGGPPSLPQARAAEEMALLDLEARRAGRPIGEPGAEAIAVNRTLGGGPPEETARRAAEGLREGFSCFKVKVGMPDDAERVAAVREAIGPWPAPRVDADGAGTVDEGAAARE